jgi:ribosomal peptide maturation radical SAM protein 1
MTVKRVLLLDMPFHALEYPSIGLSLLKAGLEGAGLPCDIRYLSLAFAERLCHGQEDVVEGLNLFSAYHDVGARFGLLADWLFSADLFGEPAEGTAGRIEDLLPRFQDQLLAPLASLEADLQAWSRQVREMRAGVTPFLEDCLARMDWDLYDIIGFSCSYQQEVASLALARRIKARYPEKTVIFGGANCEQEMGEALHRLFPFVDVVCSGKADWLFPELVRRLRAGEDLGGLPGLAFRRDGAHCSTIGQPPLGGPLDDLPYPDYRDYFTQLQQNMLASLIEPRLPFETARGCWWGQRSHCTFCGLSGRSPVYSSKSAGRAFTELAFLSERYPVQTLQSVDNILDMGYFHTLLPALEASGMNLRLMYATKANLTKEQVYRLKAAGVQGIQPGIESLSTSILRLMRKGTTCLQNVQLLKWASEAGLRVAWNLLVGLPGEDPAEYPRMAETMRALSHLEPPHACRLIRLERFSPYFDEQAALGVTRVRPLDIYRSIYPFPDKELAQLAYFFDYDHADGRDPLAYVWPVVEAVEAWHQNRRASLSYTRAGDTLLICDARGPVVTWARLNGPQRAVYEFCDAARALPGIEAHARDACQARRGATAARTPAARQDLAFTPRPANAAGPGCDGEAVQFVEPTGLEEGEYSRAELEHLLAELVDLRLMLSDDGRYLSLATCFERA